MPQPPRFGNRSRRNHRPASRRRRLLAEKLERRWLLATVTSVDPLENSHSAAVDTTVSATFDEPIDPATVSDADFVVHGTQSTGQLVGSLTNLSVAGATVSHQAVSPFKPGELIQATVRASIQSVSGGPVTPRVWQIRTRTDAGSGMFAGSGSGLGTGASFGAALGDLDGDGDLDAFVNNLAGGNRIWLNDGGDLTDSGQVLIDDEGSTSVALGDVDGDGDLDAFVGNIYQPNRLWLNDGGVFTDSGQLMGFHDSFDVALGDLDGDGDLDAFVANTNQPNRVWLNEGGRFTDSGQMLGDHTSYGVELGDVDGDGDLDAFVANGYGPNRLWLNEAGTFTDSGQILGGHDSLDVALGDLDGDGDLDAIVANYIDESRVWINNDGVFSSDQVLGSANSFGVSLGDLDGDGDLDAFVANGYSDADHVWLNDAGVFSSNGQSLGNHNSTSVSTGDLDGDGDLDAFVTNFQEGNRVWINEDAPSGLLVVSLTPTVSGFVAEFSGPLNPEFLNLYDTQVANAGAADIVVQGEIAGDIPGSLVVDAASRSVTFVRAGGELAPDTYTVTLRSGTDAFQDMEGNLLDGDGDGSGGDAFTTTFVVAEPAGDSVVASIPDFVRGPGQEINLPADESAGIPLRVSNAAGVRSLTVSIDFDADAISITSAEIGAGVPVGSAITLDTTTPGRAVLNLTSPLDFADSEAVIHLRAEVPATGEYGGVQLLDLHSMTVLNGDSEEIPARADGAVHLVSFFADVSGNGRINASDAAQVARVAALLDSGLTASLLVSPEVIADISGNRRINAADASLVARFAALIDVPQIPPLPGATASSSAGLAGSSPIVGPLDGPASLPESETTFGWRNTIPNSSPQKLSAGQPGALRRRVAQDKELDVMRFGWPFLEGELFPTLSLKW